MSVLVISGPEGLRQWIDSLPPLEPEPSECSCGCGAESDDYCEQSVEICQGCGRGFYFVTPGPQMCRPCRKARGFEEVV